MNAVAHKIRTFSPVGAIKFIWPWGIVIVIGPLLLTLMLILRAFPRGVEVPTQVVPNQVVVIACARCWWA